MQRNKKAKLSDRLTCWYLRAIVLAVFAFVSLGVWLAAQGNQRVLSDAITLLVLGSFFAFLAQSIADASGAYSRVSALNSVVRVYSLAWLPVVGLFTLWQLTRGEFRVAASCLLVGSLFWLIGYSTRARRRRREQGEHVA